MKNKLDKYFVMFSCCFITKGFNRSIIIDTQRNTFHFIPIALGELIDEFPTKTVGEIIRQFVDDEEREIFTEYLFFLEEKEIGFYTNIPASFPKINQKLLSSNIISNAILDFRKDICYDVNKHLQDLETLGCNAVQIRIFENLSQSTFDKLLESIETASFSHVELLMNADKIYNKKYLKSVLNAIPNINKIVLYKSFQNSFNSVNRYQLLESKTSTLETREQCGQMGAKYFTMNLNHVIESQSFNSCLNKKIAIDENGLIKNCPSLRENFGNAQQTSLLEAIEKKGFKDFWSIGKDQIEFVKIVNFAIYVPIAVHTLKIQIQILVNQ